MGKQLAMETPGDTNLLVKKQEHMLSKGAKTGQEVKRRWRTELFGLSVSEWKLHCDEKRCAHSQEMFKGKARSPHMEIIINGEKRNVMGTRNRTENIQIHIQWW